MDDKKILSIDRAAFLLLRVKNAFKKKRAQRKDKEKSKSKCKKPLLRSRTLPAIIVPAVSILQTQIDLTHNDNNQVSKNESNNKLQINLQVPQTSCCWRNDANYSSNSNENIYDFRRKSTMTQVSVNDFFTFQNTKHLDSPLKLSKRKLPETVIDDSNLLVNRLSLRKSNISLFPLNESLNKECSTTPIIQEDYVEYQRSNSDRKPKIKNVLQRSISIDSMMESMFETEVFSGKRHFSACSSSEIRQIDVKSPILNRKSKMQKNQNILVSSVEHGNVEKVRAILETTEADVNSTTNEGLSLLDIAVLSNNKEMAKVLLDYGAKENNYNNLDKLRQSLNQLQHDIQMRLHELGGSSSFTYSDSSKVASTRSSISSIISGSYSTSISGCAGGDAEKQIFAWDRRLKLIQRLNSGLNQLSVPSKPNRVKIEVLSSTKISMTIYEPVNQNMSIATKFKVEWSARADFNPIVGNCVTSDTFLVFDLTHGRRYYFRVSCGNLKGFSDYCYSEPDTIIPSSWKDINNRPSRFNGKLEQLDLLIHEVKQFRPCCDIFECQNSQKSRSQKKKAAIKQLFTAASKFQKNLRRGVYLATIFYSDDKVLVTNEDFLPALEIDETYPGSIHSDLHWLMKVSCFWEDIKSLKSDMEKNSTSSLHHFRSKVLTTAIQMQSALNSQNLGEFFYKPLKDSQGTMVFTTIRNIQSTKAVLVLNSRWLQISKLQKKSALTDDDSNLGDKLIASLNEQIQYHSASKLKISRGLYVSYLKLQSSVDLLHVVVPTSTPNILPHCKVRDNPHVTAEEWIGLQKQIDSSDSEPNNLTDQQKTFIKSLLCAIKCLLKYMDVAERDYITHRIYDLEVVELNSDTCLIVICPSTEQSCSIPGQREFLFQRNDLVGIPIQVFEIIHLNTYESSIINKYARLSCLLELDQVAANHLHREAFSSSELASAKERLAILRSLQSKLTLIWKSVRWLIDIITFARDKASIGVSLKLFLENDQSSNENISYLQLPPRDIKMSKNGSGRGSWPGPSHPFTNNTTLSQDLSKSEKLLPISKENSSQNLDKSSNSSSGNVKISPCSPSRSESSLLRPINVTSQQLDKFSISGKSSKSLSNIQSLAEDKEGFKVPQFEVLKIPEFKECSAILNVYAAYECGLATGTCLKVHVTEKTTAKSIVNIVVRQLKQAVQIQSKNEPIYGTNGSNDFCLVAVIGARERCLRDDFNPLLLQSPWNKSRLFVRKRSDLLAALECDNILKK